MNKQGLWNTVLLGKDSGEPFQEHGPLLLPWQRLHVPGLPCLGWPNAFVCSTQNTDALFKSSCLTFNGLAAWQKPASTKRKPFFLEAGLALAWNSSSSLVSKDFMILKSYLDLSQKEDSPHTGYGDPNLNLLLVSYAEGRMLENKSSHCVQTSYSTAEWRCVFQAKLTLCLLEWETTTDLHVKTTQNLLGSSGRIWIRAKWGGFLEYLFKEKVERVCSRFIRGTKQTSVIIYVNLFRSHSLEVTTPLFLATQLLWAGLFVTHNLLLK